MAEGWLVQVAAEEFDITRFTAFYIVWVARLPEIFPHDFSNNATVGWVGVSGPICFDSL